MNRIIKIRKMKILNVIGRVLPLMMMLMPQTVRSQQYFTLEDGTRADSCIHCEECHRFCTQMIDISKNMEEIEEFFKNAEGF